MHALGLEHEFHLTTLDNDLADLGGVYDVMSTSVNNVNWENQTFPGAWLIMIKAAKKKDLLYGKNPDNLKLAYFQRLLWKLNWGYIDGDTYYLAMLGDKVVELKYLYLFLCRDTFPDLSKISISLNDLYLVSDPNLTILTTDVSDPNVPLMIKVARGKAKVKLEKFPNIPPNENALSVWRFYKLYNGKGAHTIDVSVDRLAQLLKDYNEARVEDEYQNLIEVKSTEYVNMKIDDVIESHLEVTGNVLAIYEELYGYRLRVPDFQYIKSGDVYAGSYHVWFTLPEIKGVPRDVANYYSVLLLQWVEPLLFSYGMQDIDSLCKSTFRMCGNNMYSGFGSTDPESLLGRPKTLREVIRDGAIFYGDGGQGTISKKDFDTNVKGLDGNDIMFTEGSPRISPVLLSGGLKTYFDHIEDFSGGKGKMEKLIGNDVRFLRNYGDEHALTEEDGRLVYAYAENGWIVSKLSEKSVLDRRMFAFEVRIFDNSSLELMADKMESMALIFQHAVDTSPNIDWCFLYEDWHRAMAESLYYGHSAILNDNYLTTINKIFGTNISKTLSLDKFWEELNEALYARYKGSVIYKAFVG